MIILLLKLPRPTCGIPSLSMNTVIFHDFPGLENSYLKFHDFPGCTGTMQMLKIKKHHGAELELDLPVSNHVHTSLSRML